MNHELARVCVNDVSLSADTRWIHFPDGKPAHWYIARREFEAEGGECILSLGACHYAEAYINGDLVMRFCERSYLFDIKYKSVDITPFVKKGRNTLALVFDRMFDENRQPDLAFQIDCGKRTVLSSDESFRCTEYSPLSPGANFFIEGPGLPESFDARLDDFADAFQNGFDDSEWKRAAVMSDEDFANTFDRISQDKNEMQTNIPVFPESFVSLEKSAPQKGFAFQIRGEGFGMVLCEAEISAERDCEITVDALGGARALSMDGEIRDFGEKISLTTGAHRMALAGHDPKIFVKGEGFALGEWKKAEPVKREMPKKRVPRFPWNDLASEEKLPEQVRCFLESKSSLAVSDAGSAEYELNAAERLVYKKYFSCRGSFADSRLCGASPREACPETLGVCGEDTILHREGEMKIAPSDKDVTFILDFGVVRVGGVFLDVTAAAGVQISVSAFEAINDGGAVLDGQRRVILYTCKEGRNEYLSHTRKGFRYLLVNVPARDTELIFRSIRLYEWRYPAESVTGFVCSDSRLNEVYKMCIDTAKVCMLDAYVDCPGYEQNIWVGDAGVTALVNLANFGSFDFNERFLALVADSLSDGLRRIYRTNNKRYIEGRFLPCASFPTYPEGTIPVWSYMWVLTVAAHYEHTGDREALVRLLPSVEETLRRSVMMSDERGLLSINGAWNLIEWGNTDVSEYGECVANSIMLSYCFKKFADIQNELGNCEKAIEYAARAELIKAAVNKYAWSEERGAYVDTVRDESEYEKYLEYYGQIGKTPLTFEKYMALSRVSVQTNTLAVLYGIAEGERREKTLGILADNIEKGRYISGSPAFRTAGAPSEQEAPGGIVHIGSPFFMFFALGALFENGYAPLAIKSIAREWGDMLDAGVTTCTESFNSRTEWKTRSVSHAWSASPAYYMITELLGVKPSKPGFEEFTVEPCENTLSFARGSVPTPYGSIRVEWERDENGDIVIKCEAPKECKRV